MHWMSVGQVETDRRNLDVALGYLHRALKASQAVGDPLIEGLRDR